MDIFQHPLCTESIGAPSDMEDCQPLPVATYVDGDGKWTVSFWKPTPEDIKNLLANGSIALFVRASGRQHPVVSVTTQP